MDEHNELPDDLSQWPENNWDLFNLDSQNSSLNDLRKAYSRLIKLFRPETHPEHFQRIQEAFEKLRDLIQSGKTSEQDDREDSESEMDKEIQERRSKRQKEFLNELYNQYINNADWEGAKRFLESVIEPENPSEEKLKEISDLDEIPYLYMFWLLYTITPPKEDRFLELIKYLIMGEKVHQGEDLTISIKTLIMFFEREQFSYKNPAYDYAMNNLGFPSIIFLVNIRWLNLRFEDDVDNVDVILSDLKILKQRFMQEFPKEWVRINIEAVEFLLWTDNDKARKAIDECMESISQYSEFRDLFEDELDNLDRLEQMIKSLNEIPYILPAKVDLIKSILYMSTCSAFTRVRRHVLKFVADLGDDVLRAFLFFDYLNEHHTMVIARLFEPMQMLYLSRHDKSDLTNEQVKKIVNKILYIWKSYNCNYSACRLALLKYFLEEQLDPSDIYKYVSAYWREIENDPSQKQKAEIIKQWRSEYINDGSIALTYYAVMSCEINNMENYEDDEDD